MPVYEAVREAESAHFRYLYQASLEHLLPALIRDCEDAYDVLTPVLRWTPRSEVLVMFSDDIDLHNGWATPVPGPRMQIYASDSPVGSSIFEPGRYLRRTVFHEFTHVLTLDAQYGVGSVLADIFGRVVPVSPDPISLALMLFTLPSALFAPAWVLEGFTTWAETEFVGPGRGRNAVADMVLRVAVADGKPLDPAQWDLNLPDWPYGQAAYLYGLKVMQYAQEQYGLKDPQRHVPGELADSLARSFAFVVDRRARKATGDTFSGLARKADAAERANQKRRIDALRSQPLTKVHRLTPAGLQVDRPAFDRDGRIWFIGSPEHDRATLYRFNPNRGRAERISGAKVEVGRGSRPAIPASGDAVYYTRLVPVGRDRFWNRLHVYDARRGGVDDLPLLERCRYPAVSRDGALIAGVRVAGGVQSLVVARRGAAAGSVQALADGPVDHSIIDPVFMPDGQSVVYVVAGETNSVLRRVDLGSREDRVIFAWPYMIASPAVHPGGKEVVFASDRTGVYNLYRLRLDGRDARPEPLTHVVGGLFCPAFSADGTRLAAVAFDSGGAFLTQFDYAGLRPLPGLPPVLESAWRPLRDDEAERQAWKEKPLPPMPESVRYFSVANTRPDYWSPWIGVSSDGTVGGVQLSCSDPAGYQSLAVVAGWDSGTDEAQGAFAWRYAGFRPVFGLSATYMPVLYRDFLEYETGYRHDYEERRLEVGVAVQFLMPGPDHELSFALGYLWGRQDEHRDEYTTYDAIRPTAGGREVFEGKTAAIAGSVTWQSVTAFPRSHSAEDGLLARLSGEWMSGAVGSDLDRVAGRLDAACYLSMPFRGHVLKIEGVGGYAGGDESAQGTFGLGGMTIMPAAGGMVGVDRNVGLRGYLDNTQVGDRVTRFGMAYRLPLVGFYRSGGPVSPIYTHQVFTEVFAEGGRVWDAKSMRKDGEGWLTSCGLEVNCSLTLFHILDLAPGIGVAYAFNRDINPYDEFATRFAFYFTVKGVVNF